jgi:hypothetical protein
VNKKPNILYPISFSALLAMAGIPASAAPTPPEDLLHDPNPAGPAAGLPNKALPPKVKNARSRPVAVDVGQFQADRINLNLFQDTIFVAERDRIVAHEAGQSIWVGHLQGEPGSEVILAMRDKVVAGTIKRENGEGYEIVYQGNGGHLVRQIDLQKTAPHAKPIAVALKPQSAGQPSTGGAQTATAPMAAATLSSPTIIDTMVVYTPKARTNAGGVAGIKAKIDNAIAAANQAYLNSQVNMRLRLVYTGEVAYAETGNMSTTLTDLRGTQDGKMDIVHQWRNKYGADQVALISADANYCGIGYQMTTLSSGFAPYAFAVAHDDSRYACLATQTLAHELGHNQGNAHDRANSSYPGIYSYSYGHRVCQTGGFRTVMAYPCSGATGISYFANPGLSYNGMALGVDPAKSATNSAADAWSMNKARTTVANWRPTMTTTGTAMPVAAPTSPGNLAASPVSSGQIALDWSDTSDNEAGFRVERSLDGASWTEIANLGAGATRFADTGLAPATEYRYRVSAYNGSGDSGFAGLASATTPATENRSGPDAIAPQVSIGSPANGTQIGERVGIVARAGDNIAVQSLKLYLDGKLRAATSTDTLTYQWNAQSVAPGTHTIEVVATDRAGNTGRASIQVRK